MLERLYSSFAAGQPGAGLLLLRLVVGVLLVMQGFCHLAVWHELSPVSRGLSLLEAGAAISLVLGYLTPLTALMVGVLCVRGALFYSQIPSPNFFGATVPSLLAAAIMLAIGCLGPGAYSIDARLFGRREIIISHLPAGSADSVELRK